MTTQTDHWSRKPKKNKQRSEFLGILLVLAVAIGIWLLNGRDPGTPTAVRPSLESTESTEVRPSAPPTFSSSGEPIEESTTTPSDAPSDEASGIDPDSGLPLIAVSALPIEAVDVLERIDAGGPFRYDKDGSRFGNFEGILPDEYDGYYAEYTVDTPGASNRGARRIVTGDGDEYYWTQDHYESFSRIVR